ncbi:type VII secretion protein EccE [Rhodococcus kronopolitis]|uniref:Type VII secretion protein EccE n=1 Tax=Rhodococcus kronopolitis TaxID=1460226 RepID=A0ABV9FRK7_9NOCA
MGVFRRRGRSRRVQPRVSARTLVCAQLLAAGGAVVGALTGLTWWQGLLVAAAVTAVGLTPVRGRCLLAWVAAAWDYRTPPRAIPLIVNDFRQDDAPSIGLRWDLDTARDGTTALLAVIEVTPGVGAVTEPTRQSVGAGHRLPMSVIAAALSHHDLRLSGIDVVSHGRRTAAGSPAADVYGQLIGPLPATALRTVWLVLRFDPSAEAEAVTRRGGGPAGAARAMSVIAERTIRSLAAAGCPARVLDAAEINSAALQVGHGSRPEPGVRAWTHSPLPGAFNTGYSIDPRALTAELLAALWAQPSLGTTVALRLRPTTDPASVRIGASCRFTTATRPVRLDLPGLVSMSGRHRDALASALPAAPGHLDVLTDFEEFDLSRLDALGLPAAGCGQLIGSDADGRALATRIVGAEIGSVDVLGEPYLARQLVLRAVATGARVLVRSARPQDWEPLVDIVAAPDRLRLTHEQRIDPRFDAVLFDGVPAADLGPGVTSILLLDRPGPPGRDQPDVTVVQPGSCGDRIVLRTRQTRAELTLVTVPPESAFLGRTRTESRSGQPGYARSDRADRSASAHQAS